jgi:hypothetical protein
MHWRPLREADLSICLEMQPACLGDGLVTRAKALKVWRSLLGHPALKAMVIESEVPIAGHRIVGCGLGMFVSSQFADRELAHPRPGLNSRIIAGIVAGEPILLSYSGLGLANAGNGVASNILQSPCSRGALSPGSVSLTISATFGELLSGRCRPESLR